MWAYVFTSALRKSKHFPIYKNNQIPNTVISKLNILPYTKQKLSKYREKLSKYREKLGKM
jgi:hypothetical protein